MISRWPGVVVQSMKTRGAAQPLRLVSTSRDHPRNRYYSVLAEIEGTDRILAQWIVDELVMACRAEIEPKAFV